MAAENFTNFATGTISIPSTLLPGDTNFSLQTSQGTLFPSTNFVVLVESELMLIASRSGDTLSVQTRGFDGTTATTHSSGATVLLPQCAWNLRHLWQNVADTFCAPIPPAQLGGTASSYDNEFESAGSWTLYPSAGTGTTWNAGSALKSHLLLSRGASDNTTYTAYVSYTATSAMTLTAKLSMATSLLRTSTDQAQVSFFVSDQSNPTAGPDTGNRFKLNAVLSATTQSAPAPFVGTILSDAAALVRCVYDTSGSATILQPQMTISAGLPVWLRITYDGSGNYTGYLSGDGIVYWPIAQRGSLSFAPQSLGITFHIYNPSGQWVSQAVAVDYIRLVSGTPVGYFG